MQKVLVAGASGTLGKSIIAQLKKKGYYVRALTRNAANIPKGKANRKYVGDATDPESIKNACKDVDIVISCMGAPVTSKRVNLKDDFYEIDHIGNFNLLMNARRHKVKKFVYVSVHGDEQLSELDYVQAHRIFEEELKESGINYSIIRASAFFSALEEVFEMVHEKKKNYIIGGGEAKLNPIHQDDLAKFAVESIAIPYTDISLGGPTVYTRKQIGELAAKYLRIEAKTVNVPAFMANLGYTLLKPFNNRWYTMMKFYIKVVQTDIDTKNFGKKTLEEYFKKKAASIRRREAAQKVSAETA